VIYFAAALVLLASYIFFFQESYFAPYPYINTVVAPGFNWEGYRQIRPGMTSDEVFRLTGIQPYRDRTQFLRGQGIKTGPKFPNAYCDIYSDDKHVWGAWIYVNVCYDSADKEARVVGTNELISYN
jgi:hypothetical protein